jgi:hypothetical protein
MHLRRILFGPGEIIFYFSTRIVVWDINQKIKVGEY